MMQTTLVDPATRPMESWADPDCGTIGGQTLLSAGLTPSAGLTCGIATPEAGQDFALHSHAEPELDLALDRMAQVIVDSVPHVMPPETVLFIAGGAVHGIPQVTTRFRYSYCSPTDTFAQVTYTFLTATAQASA